jgi:hypothetical protein
VLRGPGGVTIVYPSARHLPAWTLFAPCRAREIVSDVFCRGAQRAERNWTLLPDPSGSLASCRRDPPPSPSRQRARPRRIKTPSIVRVLPPPVAPDTFAPARGITRSPPPVSLLACWWLSPPRPGFRRFFTACPRVPLDTCVAQLDPWSFDQDRAPLVDFCNQTNPRAPPPGPPDSRLFRSAEHALLALARVAGLTLPRRGWAAPHGFCATPKLRVSSLRCQPRFTGQGPWSTLVDRHCEEPLLRVARRQLYPDLLRSDTSCRETGAPSTGDFATRVARASRISTMPGAPGGGRHRGQLHLARRDPVKGQTRGLPHLSLSRAAAFTASTERLRAASSRPPRRGLEPAAPRGAFD